MKWTSVKTVLPPAGHCAIATSGDITGEAYITTVGGVSIWHRSMSQAWEAWAGKPVIGWMEMPDGKEYENG